ncbi:MAG: hypothetical protein H6Q93_1575 [Nitrospirae bacterium]|nr:hypothetical protein [Nitrospirota bacterium]
MADPSIVREWLAKADEDYNFAKINLEDDHKFYSQICFHFQQAAEKFLKAYIAAYDLEFESPTENLREEGRITAVTHGAVRVAQRCLH